MELSTLQILAVFRARVPHERSKGQVHHGLRGSVVEHRDVEFEGLRFDSSWRFRIFLCPTARDETEKHIFIFLFSFFLDKGGTV